MEYRNSVGTIWYLNSRQVELKNGNGTMTIYYFSLGRRSTAVDAMPEGYEVIENSRNHVPFLRKAS